MPETAELTLKTEGTKAEDLAEEILGYLRSNGFVP
jgi:hypothetical protein